MPRSISRSARRRVTSSPTTGIILLNVASDDGRLGRRRRRDRLPARPGSRSTSAAATVSLSYGGNITKANSFAMVSVSGGHTTGTITFSGTLNATSGHRPALRQRRQHDVVQLHRHDDAERRRCRHRHHQRVGRHVQLRHRARRSPTRPARRSSLAGSNANVTYSGSITDNTGFAVDIDNHDAGTVTFQTGSITSTGTGIQVANSNGGTINFNSPTIALTTGANKAVTLDVDNAGGTINFNPAAAATASTSRPRPAPASRRSAAARSPCRARATPSLPAPAAWRSRW